MTLEDLLLEITKAIRDAEERIIARIATSYPQKSPLKKNSRGKIDFAMGLWIIPAEVRADWAKQYPDADIDAALKTTAQLMTSGKPRPRPAHYDRFIRARIRTEQGKAMARAEAKRAIDARPVIDCANAPGCQAKALVSLSVGGAVLSFCVECADKERARIYREGAGAKQKQGGTPPAHPATSAEAEAALERIRGLLKKPRSRAAGSDPLHIGVLAGRPMDLSAEAEAAHHASRRAAPASAPEREPGSDDE